MSARRQSFRAIEGGRCPPAAGGDRVVTTGRIFVAAIMRRHGFQNAADAMLAGELPWFDALPDVWRRFDMAKGGRA